MKQENTKDSYLLVMLHGYGSNGKDLMTLSPIFQHHFPNLEIIALDAPTICPQATNGRQWFELSDLSPSSLEKGAQQALPSIISLLNNVLKKHEKSWEDLILLGFSQGTMMALQVAMHHPPALCAVIGFSGLLASPPTTDQNIKACPVHLIHGDQDNVVPLAGSIQAREKLQSSGFPTSLLICQNIGHEINEEGLMSAITFLDQRLA